MRRQRNCSPVNIEHTYLKPLGWISIPAAFLFHYYTIHTLYNTYYSNVIDRSVRAIPSVPISRSAGRK